MSSNVDIAIVTGVLSGGFALLGGAITTLTAGRRERRNFETETALELAGMERLVWGEDWTELEAHLQREEARLAIARVPNDLVTALNEISSACWRDLRDSREVGDEYPGMDQELIEARRGVHRAIRAYLLREGRASARHELRRKAIAGVQTALADYQRRRYGAGG
jgi:hypothetical protein